MRVRLLTVAAVLAGILVWNASFARASGDGEGDRVHFEIGLGGVTGMDKVDRADRSEFNQLAGDNANIANGGDGGPLRLRSDELPVGPMFNAYYEFGFGLGLGGGVGPITVGDRRIRDDASTTDPFNRNEFGYFIAPAGLDVRYEFINKSGVVPYVRAGFRYPLVATYNYDRGWEDDRHDNRGGAKAFGGISDRRLGAFGAVGIEFPRAHFGMEAAYDSSKFTVTNSFRSASGTTFISRSETVEPDQFMFSVFFRF